MGDQTSSTLRRVGAPIRSVALTALSFACLSNVATGEAAQTVSGTGEPRATLYRSQALLYSRDHEIPFEVATRRLEWQRLAPGLQERARRELGLDFGGVWIDSTAGGRVKLGLTGSRPALARKAKAIVAKSGLSQAADIVQVPHSETALNHISDWLNARLARTNTDISTPLAFGLLPEQSAVQISLPSDYRLDPAVLRLIADARQRYGEAVKITTHDDQVIPAACSHPFCTPPLRAGIRIGPELIIEEDLKTDVCTAGFLGRGNVDGALYQFTAGHCYFLFEAEWGTKFSSKESWQEIGVWKKHIVEKAGDAAVYKITDDSTWHSRPWVYWNGYSDSYPIFSDANPVKGQTVCMSGGLSSPTSCGEVTSALETVVVDYDFPWEPMSVELAKANLCSKDGDSGAPVHYYGIAYGLLTSSVAGKCESYFTRISTAEQKLAVNVRHESECDPLFESSVKIGDMTGDGKADIFQFPGGGGKGYAWESKGTSYTGLGEVVTGTGSPYQVRIGDVDGDGDDDVFQFTDSGVGYAWESKGTSYTGLGEVGDNFGSACDTRLADINGDSEVDVLRFTNDGYAYGWLANEGEYEELGQVGTGFGSTYQDRTGDMNGDGDDDLFQILDNGKVYKWDSNGSSYSGGSELFSGVGNASQVRFADTEGDGDDDIFRFTDAGVGSLWKSKGSAYESIGTIGTGFGVTRQMRVADIDGDGDADILKFADDGNGYAWKFNGSTYESIGKIGSGFGAP